MLHGNGSIDTKRENLQGQVPFANWHTGCPNYQMNAFVFLIFTSAGEGEGWFEGDST